MYFDYNMAGILVNMNLVESSKIYWNFYADEDSDYQHISEATTARVHKSPTYHPHSDTEDSVFYPDTPSSG